MTEATDFGNSYMTWVFPPNLDDKRVPGHVKWENTARILLDARCELIDQRSQERDEFFLIAPCRGEWMYQPEHIFLLPSPEYRMIYSRERELNVGKGLTYEGEGPRSGLNASHYTDLHFIIRSFPETTVLSTDDEVVRATLKDLPIVARTEIWDEGRGLRAVLEYPVRTMNVQQQRRRFQVDTGPLIVPDFTSQAEHWIEWCRLAHVVYNTFDRAEFVVRRPTPIVKEGREVASILYYSEAVVYPARHTLLCAGQL